MGGRSAAGGDGGAGRVSPIFGRAPGTCAWGCAEATGAFARSRSTGGRRSVEASPAPSPLGSSTFESSEVGFGRLLLRPPREPRRRLLGAVPRAGASAVEAVPPGSSGGVSLARTGSATPGAAGFAADGDPSSVRDGRSDRPWSCSGRSPFGASVMCDFPSHDALLDGRVVDVAPEARGWSQFRAPFDSVLVR